jgi:serine/threonine-protein kinase
MPTDIIARKYRIVREIARSNDVVYEAVDATMGRRLAIKELLIPPNLTGAARDERIERFNREARAAGKLSHHNIVTVYDFGEDNGRYFIAMEYLEGATLRDLLQARGALPYHEAADITSQVLAALAHAHAHSVIHRDVKPDNIHILPDGIIKLTDFGIARLTEEASLTGDGQVFGTPSYMSPEQIEGRFIDHRSDLFSVGIVLYEMLAGRKPFTGDSVVSITYAIMNAEPPPLVGVPYPLERLVSRALSKDPSMRFQSAAEMRNAIREALAVPAMLVPGSPTSGTMSTVPANPAQFGAPAGRPWTPQPSPWQSPPTSAPIPPRYPGVPAGPGLIPTGVSQPGPTVAPPASVQPAQPVAGPFATWGAPSTQAGPPPQPMVSRPSAPLISEGALIFFRIMAISFVLASIVLGSVLLFVRSYEQHQLQGATLALRSRLAEGDRYAQSGDLEAAATRYEQVLTSAPRSTEGRVARTSLATVLNRMGVRAAELGRTDIAARHFQSVADLYTHYPDGLTQTDLQEWDNANENLARLGSFSQQDAPAPFQRLPDGQQGVSPPSGGAPMAAEAQADALLEQGNRAYANGDIATAREYWTRAVGVGPGTPAGLEAQRKLDLTVSPPGF